MKTTTICIATSFAALVLARPIPQPNEPWADFFSPDTYYPSSPLVTQYPPQQVPPPPTGGPNDQIAPPPRYMAPTPYGAPYEGSGVPLPPPAPRGPTPYGGPYEAPNAPYYPPTPQSFEPQFPQPPAPGPLDGPDLRPTGSLQPPRPAAKAPKPKISKPVSEKPHDKKPLADKFAPEIEMEDPAPAPPPQGKPVVEDKGSDNFDKDAIRYRMNVGGIQKGGQGGATNFHVYSDENGNKHYSDELDEETEKYITENMIPKLGGKRKGGSRGGVWSVFGDK